VRKFVSKLVGCSFRTFMSNNCAEESPNYWKFSATLRMGILYPYPSNPSISIYVPNSSFNVPLKSEHRQYFLRIILPLHKTQGYLTYFAPLIFCTALFLEKDPTLAKPTFVAILHYWPKYSSTKEVSTKRRGE
jgi:hypothetical protein